MFSNVLLKYLYSILHFVCIFHVCLCEYIHVHKHTSICYLELPFCTHYKHAGVHTPSVVKLKYRNKHTQCGQHTQQRLCGQHTQQTQSENAIPLCNHFYFGYDWLSCVGCQRIYLSSLCTLHYIQYRRGINFLPFVHRT